MSTPEQAANEIGVIVGRITDGVRGQLESRGYRASNALRNSVLQVLSGQRSGKRYFVPRTRARYTASASGEAPANRTGVLRLSFQSRTYVENRGGNMEVHGIAESDYRLSNGELLGEMLEEGTPRGKIAPRPFKQAAIDRAMPEIEGIFSEPYT